MAFPDELAAVAPLCFNVTAALGDLSRGDTRHRQNVDALRGTFVGRDEADDLQHHHAGLQGWHSPHMHFGNNASP